MVKKFIGFSFIAGFFLLVVGGKLGIANFPVGGILL